MKMGILGTGQIVQDMLPMVHELDFDGLAILGRESKIPQTEALARQYGIDACYYSYDEMLHSDIDTIYVALPNSLHHPFAKKALEAGKNVIVEKPATSNADELEELCAVARDKNKILVEAMTTHYLPAYKGIKADLHKLGEIRIISVNYSQYSSRYDSFKKGEILPAFDPHKSGGALMDLNVYNLHFVVGLFGEPQRCFYHANVQRGIDTSGIMILEYEGFKAVCIGAKDCKAPILSSIQGDNGNILVRKPVNQMQEYEINDNIGSSETKNFSEGHHRMYYEFREFIRMIDTHDKTRADEMMSISLSVSRIMQEGRRQEGIIFDNDK